MLFILVCILAMWLMIFGVGFLYAGMLPKHQLDRMLVLFICSLLVASIMWLFGGYFLAYEGHFDTVLSATQFSLEKLLSLFFQLCFCWYAVVMLIGSVLNRVRLSGLVAVVAIWVVLVYVPLVYLIWNPQGLLSQWGALDFSGGLVVHVSAGVGSYTLAFFLGKSQQQASSSLGNEWLYLGMLFVTLGWFGFNAGPAQVFDQKAGIILINTLLAILAGGVAWSVVGIMRKQNIQLASLCNGMIVGLVTSTTGVGFLDPLEMLLVTFLASFVTALAVDWLAQKAWIEDAVDSFSMNAIGGCLGCLGLICFRPSILGVELVALLLTIVLSISVTSISCLLFRKWLTIPKSFE